MFEREHRPKGAMSAFDAHNAFIRNEVELVALTEIRGQNRDGRRATVSTGVYCIVPVKCGMGSAGLLLGIARRG